MDAGFSGRYIVVKKSLTALVVMNAIADVARAAEGSADHHDR